MINKECGYQETFWCASPGPPYHDGEQISICRMIEGHDGDHFCGTRFIKNFPAPDGNHSPITMMDNQIWYPLQKKGDLWYIKIRPYHGASLFYSSGHIERPDYWHGWIYKPNFNKDYFNKEEFAFDTFESAKKHIESELSVKIK